MRTDNIFLTIFFLKTILCSAKGLSFGISEISISPSYKKIALIKTSKDNQFMKRDLIIFDVNSQKIEVPVFSNRVICFITWSLDENKIYYRKGKDICVYNFISKEESFLFKANEHEFIGAVRFSPSRDFIGFDMVKFPPLVPEMTPKEIWLLDIKTKKKFQITEDGIAHWGGWIWLNEKEVLYSKEKKKGLYALSIETKKERKLIDDFSLCSILSISPDKSKIAFYDDYTTNYYIFSIPENRIIFTGDKTPVSDFHWSPDGENLIFTNDEDIKGLSPFYYYFNFWLVNLKNFNKRKVIVPIETPIFHAFAWLSNTEIVFCSVDGTVWVYNILTGSAEKLFVLDLFQYKKTKK